MPVQEHTSRSMLPGWVLLVSLVFGLSITLLAYTIGHFSGGHINCAVTFGLVLAGQCEVVQGIANFVAQMLGSVTGAGLLCLVYPAAKDNTGGLGSNGVGPNWGWNNALIGEIMGTFLLVYVVLQTACNPKSAGNRAQACIAIGLAVFVAHTVLIPIDGCSINPTRSFGPALVAHFRYGTDTFKDMGIFWVGPLIGAGIAAMLYKLMLTLEERSEGKSVSIAAGMAEFIAMTLFVVFGCGSAMGLNAKANGGVEEAGTHGSTSAAPEWVLMVALVFGLNITLLAYSTGHHSGGHINCAVTLGLVVAGACGFAQGLVNFVMQMIGSVTGAVILCFIYPVSRDHTGSLGSNGGAPGYAWHNILVGEIIGTFILMQVVLQTAVSAKSAGNRAQACIAIGLAVFAAHVILIPIDGCSINPTRSFGPALVAQFHYGVNGWKDMWIFWVGPLVGAALSAGFYELVLNDTPNGEETHKLTGEDSESGSE